MKVCLIPLIPCKLAISDPPSLKFFMNLNQFSHQYVLKQLHTIRPHFLYCIVFFAGVFFLHIFLSEMKWACGAAGLGMAPPQFQASHLRMASLGFLIAPKPRASSESLCTICDAERACKRILPAMQRPTADRRGNVCQFNTAGSNGSSISLPKRPAFSPKLISSVSFSGSCQG